MRTFLFLPQTVVDNQDAVMNPDGRPDPVNALGARLVPTPWPDDPDLAGLHAVEVTAILTATAGRQAALRALIEAGGSLPSTGPVTISFPISGPQQCQVRELDTEAIAKLFPEPEPEETP